MKQDSEKKLEIIEKKDREKESESERGGGRRKLSE
jgi:hypothetical protein